MYEIVWEIEIYVQIFDKATKNIYDLPSALTVWSTGITKSPLISQFTSSLPPDLQSNRVAVTTDEYLQVLGTEGVAAIGDCAGIERKLLFEKYEELFQEFDENADGMICFSEFKRFVQVVTARYPQLSVYGKNLVKEFAEMDTSGVRSPLWFSQ